jgi:hypothetical protein
MRTAKYLDGERLIEQQARRLAHDEGLLDVEINWSFKLTLGALPQRFTLALRSYGHIQEAVFTGNSVQNYADARGRQRVDAIVREAVSRLVDATASDRQVLTRRITT